MTNVKKAGAFRATEQDILAGLDADIISITTLPQYHGSRLEEAALALLPETHSIVVFGLPILDTVVALTRRLLNHRPLFVSDRGHIYDQMLDRGIPFRKTVAICYVLASLYAIIGLVVGLTTKIRTWPYALIVYILVFVLSVLVVWKKGYLRMEGLRGAIRNKDK